MRTPDAIKKLENLDALLDRYIYTRDDLRIAFPDEADKTLEKTIEKLVKEQILSRPARGVYLFELSRNKNNGYLLEAIARTLRQNEQSYVSLESALSEYGVISQIPISHLTVMTTGRAGKVETPYGVIEFTHTKRGFMDIVERCQDIPGRPLPLATKEAAYADLKRVGRNLNMVDTDMLEDE